MKSFQTLRDSFREEVVQLIWDSWVAIGFAGGGRRSPVPFVIDPEALILGTLQFGQDEPRLLEGALDWMESQSGLLSLQRLKSLQTATEIADSRWLAALADHFRKRGPSGRNWGGLASMADGSDEVTDLRWLFPDGLREQRSLSQRPNIREPAAFLFKMRAFFGVNARAEIFVWLLARGQGHPAAIARETGWFSKTVQVVLNELSQSGVVTVESRDREKTFRLRREPWNFLLPGGATPVWQPQAPLFAACRAIEAALAALSSQADASPSLKAIGIRKELAVAQPSLRLAGLDGLYAGADGLGGDDLVAWFQEETGRLIADLAGARAFRF